MKTYRIVTVTGDEELVRAPNLATARQLAESLGENIAQIIAEDLDDEGENDEGEAGPFDLDQDSDEEDDEESENPFDEDEDEEDD